MSEERELTWGATPWDDWGREALLRKVQQLYAALQAAHGVVDLARTNDAWPFLNSETPQARIAAEIDRIARERPFWGTQGRGGRAYEMSRQALELDADYGDSLYRSFYRYTHDLLFDERQAGMQIGFGWAVCSECGQMVGRGIQHTENQLIGKPCAGHGFGKPGCSGTFRPLAWEDMKPRKEGGEDA